MSHPGRIGWGTAISASSSAASTAFVPSGRSTAARIDRVATSTAMVSSGRAGRPSSLMAITSSRVVSTCTISPGRSARVGVNGPTGTAAPPTGRAGSSRVSTSAFTSRLNVESGGTFTWPAPWASSRICPVKVRRPFNVPLERPRWRRTASSTAATTRSSARPVGLVGRRLRPSTSPHNPPSR